MKWHKEWAETHAKKPRDGVDRNPPCWRCPKFLLHPPGFGLLPANALAVHLYRMAAVDVRAGDCGFLVATLTPDSASKVLDEYAHHFPTHFSRQQTFELMWLIGQIATDVRSRREESERKKQMDAMDAKRKTGRK